LITAKKESPNGYYIRDLKVCGLWFFEIWPDLIYLVTLKCIGLYDMIRSFNDKAFEQILLKDKDHIAAKPDEFSHTSFYLLY
jgi:hypothetical protein